MSTDEPKRILEQFRTLIDEARVDAARVDDACVIVRRLVATALEREAWRTTASVIGQATGPLVSVGRWDAALELVDEALEGIAAERAPVARGRLLAARSGLLRTPRRYAEALEDLTAAIELLDEHVTEAVITTLRHDRAVLLADLGHADDAVTGLVAAREAFLGMRDRVGVAASDHNLGFVLHDLGVLDDAIEYLTEARDIFLAIDMGEEAASCDQNLGVVLYDANRLADAGRRFAAAHHRFVECDATVSAAECDANVSTLLTTMGQPAEAARYRRRAEASGVGIPTAPGTSSQLPSIAAPDAVDDAAQARRAEGRLPAGRHDAGKVGSASA